MGNTTYFFESREIVGENEWGKETERKKSLREAIRQMEDVELDTKKFRLVQEHPEKGRRVINGGFPDG